MAKKRRNHQPQPKDRHENKGAEMGDLCDDLIDPLADDNVSGAGEADASRKDWHICRDFIDPLKDEVVEWLRNWKRRIEDVENLRYILLPVTGIGYQPAVEAWNRARVCLDLNAPVGYSESFKRKITGVLDESQALPGRLNRLALEGNLTGLNNEFSYFEYIVVEQLIEDLRNISLELEKKLPSDASPAVASKSRKGRGKWPALRTEPAVAQYLTEHAGLYKELVPFVLDGDNEGTKRFKANFGATAIAQKIGNKAGSGEGDACGKSQVQVTQTYKDWIYPLFKKPPKTPKHWTSRTEDPVLRSYVQGMTE